MKFSKILILLCLIIVGCNKEFIKTNTGLQYKIIKKGEGKKVKNGDEILLYETTSYRDGTILYSNENSGNPIKIKVGAGQVTLAVDEGLKEMKTGEIKKIIAPPNLVKRTFYPKNVSPDSTLVIKLILHKIL